MPNSYRVVFLRHGAPTFAEEVSSLHFPERHFRKIPHVPCPPGWGVGQGGKHCWADGMLIWQALWERWAAGTLWKGPWIFQREAYL